MTSLLELILPIFGLYVSATCADPIPRIVSPQNVTVEAGDIAVLRCVVDNLGFRTVVWHKSSIVHALTIGSYVYTTDKNIGIYVISEDNDRKSFNLVIHDTQDKDAGVYQCQITGRFPVRQNYVLNVLYRK